MTNPTPNQTYRHRKHDPAAGHWHEYKVIGVVEPHQDGSGDGPIRTHYYYPQQYRHTGTEELVVLIGCGGRIFADVTGSHVAYKNTRPKLCNPDWVFYLRPLEEFTDGRFCLIEPDPAD